MDANAQGPEGHTPLHLAAICGQGEVVRLLLGANANPNARTAEGWTPLHCAAERGHAEVAALLVKAGADAGVRTDFVPERQVVRRRPGVRPLIIPAKPALTAAEIARDAGHEELVKLLTRIKG